MMLDAATIARFFVVLRITLLGELKENTTVKTFHIVLL